MYNALHALYIATNGQNWVWSGPIHHWDFTISGDACEDQWQGVTCNTINAHVKEIDLYGFNSMGKMSAELGSLSSLQRLHLYSNQLTGTIPAELGSLSSLQLLKSLVLLNIIPRIYIWIIYHS